MLYSKGSCIHELYWYCRVHKRSLQECPVYSSLLVRSTRLNVRVCLDAAYKNSCLLTAVSISERQAKLSDSAFPLIQFYLFGLYTGSGKHKISFFEVFQNLNRFVFCYIYKLRMLFSWTFFFYHKSFLLYLNFSRRNSPFHITPVLKAVTHACTSTQHKFAIKTPVLFLIFWKKFCLPC